MHVGGGGDRAWKGKLSWLALKEEREKMGKEREEEGEKMGEEREEEGEKEGGCSPSLLDLYAILCTVSCVW